MATSMGSKTSTRIAFLRKRTPFAVKQCARDGFVWQNGSCVYRSTSAAGAYKHNVKLVAAKVDGYTVKNTFVPEEGWYMQGVGFCKGVYYVTDVSKLNEVTIGEDPPEREDSGTVMEPKDDEVGEGDEADATACVVIDPATGFCLD